MPTFVKIIINHSSQSNPRLNQSQIKKCEISNQKIISDQVEFHPSQVSLLGLNLTPITSYYIPIHGEKEKRQ